MQFSVKYIEIRDTPLSCIYQQFTIFFNLEYYLTSNTISHHPEMVVLKPVVKAILAYVDEKNAVTKK